MWPLEFSKVWLFDPQWPQVMGASVSLSKVIHLFCCCHSAFSWPVQLARSCLLLEALTKVCRWSPTPEISWHFADLPQALHHWPRGLAPSGQQEVVEWTVFAPHVKSLPVSHSGVRGSSLLPTPPQLSWFHTRSSVTLQPIPQTHFCVNANSGS